MTELCVANIGSPRQMAFFAFNCLAHQSVLAMKPTIKRIGVGDVAGNLTRGGHLWQGGKFFTDFMKRFEDLISRATFRNVAILPPQIVAAMAQMKQILVRSRPCLDLKQEEDDFIVVMWNFEFSAIIDDHGPDDFMVHWHSPGCTCGGARSFRTQMLKAGRLIVGGGPAQCLLYRWKGFEQAVCWWYRISSISDMDLRVIANLVSNKDHTAAFRGRHSRGQTLRL